MAESSAPVDSAETIVAGRLATLGWAYPLHEAVAVLAALTEAGYEVRICSRCHGRGVRVPYCFLCEDSTGDHECPDEKPCSCALGRRRAASQPEQTYASVTEISENAPPSGGAAS